MSETDDTGQTVSKLLEATIRGRSLRRVANLTGVSKSTIGNILAGGNASARTLEDLAHGLSVPAKPLLDAAGLAPTGRRVGDRGPFLDTWGVEIDAGPLAGALRDVRTVGAGSMRLVDADTPGEDLAVGPLRAWRVVGDCMAPVLLEGDEILVAPAESAVDGSVVVAAVDLFYVTCKRLSTGRCTWQDALGLSAGSAGEEIEKARR